MVGLTAKSGVSQPAVSKHLSVLKKSGLVRRRHEGRLSHYSAQPAALAPLMDWASEMVGFWHTRLDQLEETPEENGSVSNEINEGRTIVVERELPHPPERVWRALTQPHLLKEWLMENDFKPVAGHRFQLKMPSSPNWNGVTDCEVLAVDAPRKLSYSWNSSGDEAANGLRTVVTWNLSPSGSGTKLRMEQSGFRTDQRQNYQGAAYGWQKFLGALETVVAGMNDEDVQIGDGAGNELGV